MRPYIRLFVFSVIAIVVGILAFNLLMPRGYHFVIAIVDDRREIAKVDQIVELNGLTVAADIATFRPMSKWLASSSSNPCDMPTFLDSRIIDGKNGAIGTYIQFYKYIPTTDNGLVLSYLEDALHQCDPNLKSADQNYPPLFYAIFLKHPDLVSLLLRFGAKVDLRISNPGKPTDGMNALEFARLLETRARDDPTRKSYAKIAALIDHHNAAAPAQTPSTGALPFLPPGL